MITLLREEPVARRQDPLLLRGSLQAGLFLVLAFALMATSFGDTNRHADETFYFLVGQRMHEGLLPYVDVWDRKPLGLFLMYYLIAGISASVLAYQITACLFAAATAYVISRTVQHLTGGQSGLLAGLCYLLAIVPLEGITGQTPDFYNLFIASAALLIVQQIDSLRQGKTGWRSYAAMALCGLAITIKQTAVFESVFLGLVVLTLVKQSLPWSKVAPIALSCLAIGALPMLLIAAYYWQAGHWPEFWHAMVTSNFVKAGSDDVVGQIPGTLLPAIPVLALAAWGLQAKATDRRAKLFVGVWLAAAMVGFLSVPNFYPHYMLPVMVPVSVAAGLILANYSSRLILTVALAVYALLWFSPFQINTTRESNRSITALANLIRQHDSGGGGLLVFDAPPYLYALTDKRFLSPLVFPHHLNHAIETDVSHLNTRAEIDRIIAARPGVIVMSDFPRNNPVNAYSRSKVLSYARAHCQKSGVVDLREGAGSIPTVVFGNCR